MTDTGLMRFDSRGVIGFSEEQAEILDVAINFCRDKSPIEKVRALIEDETGFDPAVWAELAELGWLAIALPEEFGGIGLSLAEVVPVVEQMGRRLMNTPFIPTTLAAQALLAGGTDAQKADLLPRLAAGTIATLALYEDHGDWDLSTITATATREGDGFVLAGQKFLVQDAAEADVIIATVSLMNAPALVVIDTAKLAEGALRREVIIDETKRSYALTLDGVTVGADALLDPAKAGAALEAIEMAAGLLLSAEMCGAAQSTVDYIVEYLNTRKQFGKLIGSFQAVKHPTVDAYVSYEKARSLLYSAAYMFDQQGEGEIAVRMAKAEAGEALSYAADRAIQFHGGFGFTYDCDAQLYRRRGIYSEAVFGDAIYHRKKLAPLMLG